MEHFSSNGQDTSSATVKERVLLDLSRREMVVVADEN
jgi:hypothetical protein